MAIQIGSGMRTLAVTVSGNPDSIGANTTGTVSLTVDGARPGGVYIIQAPSTVDAGIITQSVGVCNTAGTVIVRLANVTGTPIDVGATNFVVIGL